MEQSGEAGDASLFERLKGYLRLYGWEHALTLGAAEELLREDVFNLDAIGASPELDEPSREAIREGMLELIRGLMANAPKVYGWSLKAFNANFTVARALKALGEDDLAIAELRALFQARERFQDWNLGWSAMLLNELVAYELVNEQFAEVIVHASWLTDEVAVTDMKAFDTSVGNIILDCSLQALAHSVCAFLALGLEEAALSSARKWLSVLPSPTFNDQYGAHLLMDSIRWSPRSELISDAWDDEIVPRLSEILDM